MALIEIQDIVKNYFLGKVTIPALKQINLKINKGDYVCVVGPSGSGKSTLLNIIGLIDSSNEGKLYIDGKEINKMNETQIHRFRKKRISFIFQSFNLIPALNAYENIEFPLLIQRIKKKERMLRIQKFAKAVQIDEYLNHRPDELSGGQRQRISIARALVTYPEIVLADEPTANLDSKTGNSILTLMRELNETEKITFIIASHDEKIMQQADRIVKIVDGEIAQ